MNSIPLFDRIPLLANAFPYLSIGNFPTSIDPLTGLGKKLNRKNLFVKRDDLSGPVYGGNKVRKLEFLLADAKRSGAVRVITSGAAGSNHALATALYAKQAGLKATLVLSQQELSPVVCGNLLADAFAGAEMVYEEEYGAIASVIDAQIKRYERIEGKSPYLIPAGGSSPLGAMGYVNAAFELKEQVDNGAVPEPAAIIVALGTMGTAAGLLLGIKAAGLKTKLVGVRVVPPVVASGDKFTSLFRAMNALLMKHDPSIPEFSLSDGDFTISHDYYEPGYGSASKAVVSAIAALERTERIHLDITYSGKAFAAFYDMARKNTFADGPLLFWNTKNSRELPEASKKIDFRTLPADFHKYFEC